MAVREPDDAADDAAPLPPALTVTESKLGDDPYVWTRRAIFLGALVIGWVFIGWQNRFYFSPPTAFVGLAYFAVLSTIYALWRTGVVAVTDEADDADSTWGRPVGRRGELEREKRTLLKAIKEAEFDREMGKLSARDAEDMIHVYRLRAIEVIKEIDKVEAGDAGSVREQIVREVKARLEMDQKSHKAKADAKADAARDRKKKAKPSDQPVGDDEAATTAAEVAAAVKATAAGENPTEFDSTEAASTRQAKEAST